MTSLVDEVREKLSGLLQELQATATSGTILAADATEVDQLPSWAQRYIRKLRQEAAASRVFVREMENRLAKMEGRLIQAREDAVSIKDPAAAEKRKIELAQMEMLIELRREELEEIRQLMVASPASAEHRGSRSFRPVPDRSRASGL